MTPEELKKQEQVKNMRSWIDVKETQVHTLRQNVALQEFVTKQAEVNIKDGWYLNDKKRKILEATTDYERKIANFELKTMEKDIENGLLGELDKIKLEELKTHLLTEEKILKTMQSKLKAFERNGKDEVKNGR